ncbi:DUF4326 domain-containing protein [Kineosporia babensis]|uniref:DUF4326 domain-containing protein n=1 Tax=Kineosporia babensis TaxID=499548 RepID=A0A9X1N9B1_9ACTN|nr:DUF4326 domain-containing protein [Kineosporia babensis]MCD5310922.1 DUF4326 domain-containing protein [Kineosporia babensis]
MPERIQRRRVRGWRLPANATIVDRTSRWGNPFRVSDLTAWGVPAGRARAEAVKRFGDWLDGTDWHDVEEGRRMFILNNIHELAGRDLACTCPLDELPCHANEYLRRANP